MKRILNTLICMAAALLSLSCQKELVIEVPVSESIVLDLSSGSVTKAADLDYESFINHIDVMIFNVGNDRKPSGLVYYEKINVEGASSVTLSARRSDFTAGQTFFVYLVANSSLNYAEVADFNTLNNLMQEDPLLHLTALHLDGVNNPKYFLMDAIAKDNGGNSPVVLNDGNVANNTELEAVLRRAAAKVVINIKAGDKVTFKNYGIAEGSVGGLYYVRNLPYDTHILAETKAASDILTAKLVTTSKTDSKYFSWNPESDSKNVSLVTYVYPHHWVNSSILEKETCVVINLPMDFVNAQGKTVAHYNSWYKIPMTDNATFERNHYYEINIDLNRPGAVSESEPIKIKNLYYSVEPWTGVTVGVGNESRPNYLQLNTDHVDMYNVNTDDKTLKFYSSSEIDKISLVSAVYINKFGQTVNVNEDIRATAASGLSGGITIFSSYVKEEGVVAQDSHNNVIRYMEFVVYNETGQSARFTVNQYPTIYITHEVGHYSYRDDFGGTSYLAAGDPNYSGANWNNNGWSYTQNASSSNFFASKVADSYTLDSVSGKGTLQDPTTGTNYNLSYVYWGTSGSSGGWPGSGWPGGGSSGGSGQLTRRTDGISSGFNNPRMYHVHVTATSKDYILARPRLDNLGFTESSLDNTMLVSPSFMIASQLGTTDMSGGTSSISIDKAKQHCEKYVEVTYDSAGNRVVYDDWRLPTAAEIDIILAHQYDSQAMVEVLSGRRYYCALNPEGTGDQQYLRENKKSTGGSNHVRCIRDAY